MNHVKPIQSNMLPNGLFVCIYDRTKPYFGDFHHVIIEIVCSVGDSSTVANKNRLNAIYSRNLEKMGVASKDVENVIQKLIDDFNANSLPYLSLDEFPARMAKQNLLKYRPVEKKYLASGF